MRQERKHFPSAVDEEFCATIALRSAESLRKNEFYVGIFVRGNSQRKLEKQK